MVKKSCSQKLELVEMCNVTARRRKRFSLTSTSTTTLHRQNSLKVKLRIFLIFQLLHTFLHFKNHQFTLILNLLKAKRNLLYIRNQSVPRCKHFPPRL